MVHLPPTTWNHREGDTVEVWAYANVDTVELYLNGRSLGTCTFDTKKTVDGRTYLETSPRPPATTRPSPAALPRQLHSARTAKRGQAPPDLEGALRGGRTEAPSPGGPAGRSPPTSLCTARGRRTPYAHPRPRQRRRGRPLPGLRDRRGGRPARRGGPRRRTPHLLRRRGRLPRRTGQRPPGERRSATRPVPAPPSTARPLAIVRSGTRPGTVRVTARADGLRTDTATVRARRAASPRHHTGRGVPARAPGAPDLPHADASHPGRPDTLPAAMLDGDPGDRLVQRLPQGGHRPAARRSTGPAPRTGSRSTTGFAAHLRPGGIEVSFTVDATHSLPATVEVAVWDGRACARGRGGRGPTGPPRPTCPPLITFEPVRGSRVRLTLTSRHPGEPKGAIRISRLEAPGRLSRPRGVRTGTSPVRTVDGMSCLPQAWLRPLLGALPFDASLYVSAIRTSPRSPDVRKRRTALVSLTALLAAAVTALPAAPAGAEETGAGSRTAPSTTAPNPGGRAATSPRACPTADCAPTPPAAPPTAGTRPSARTTSPLVAGESYRLSFTATGTPADHVVRAIMGLSVSPVRHLPRGQPAAERLRQHLLVHLHLTRRHHPGPGRLPARRHPDPWRFCVDDVSLLGGVAPEPHVPDTGAAGPGQPGRLPAVRPEERHAGHRRDLAPALAAQGRRRPGRRPRLEQAARRRRLLRPERPLDRLRPPQEARRGLHAGRRRGDQPPVRHRHRRLRAAAHRLRRSTTTHSAAAPRSAATCAPGYARPAGHVGVAPNQGDTDVPCQPGVCDYTLDVSGGWYDAGDHGKYVVNGGISTWELLSTYERSLHARTGEPSKLGDGTLDIPESGNKVPDILDEVRWELDFLLKMQVPDGQPLAGMAHYKIHDERGPDCRCCPATTRRSANCTRRPPRPPSTWRRRRPRWPASTAPTTGSSPRRRSTRPARHGRRRWPTRRASPTRATASAAGPTPAGRPGRGRVLIGPPPSCT